MPSFNELYPDADVRDWKQIDPSWLQRLKEGVVSGFHEGTECFVLGPSAGLGYPGPSPLTFELTVAILDAPPGAGIVTRLREADIFLEPIV